MWKLKFTTTCYYIFKIKEDSDKRIHKENQSPQIKSASADHISFDFWSLFFCAKLLDSVHIWNCLNSNALPSVKVPFFINKSKKPGMVRHPRRKYTMSLLGFLFFIFFWSNWKMFRGNNVAFLLGRNYSSTLLRYFIVISSPLVLILLHPLFHISFFASTFIC